MKRNINNRFGLLFGSLLAAGLLFAGPGAAQEDAASAEVETVATAETDSTETVAEAAATTATAVSAAIEEVAGADPQMYKNLVYYVLLILVSCTIVALVLKVISIYEMTAKISGTYRPLKNNTLQAVLLFVFLVLFLAFVYYSYAVWGAWSWRAAVTEHGKDVDTMFIITTVITTFVLVVVQILLLSFPYFYRMRANKKAYYYPHNDSIERLWTIVPAVVLTVLVLFGFFTWRKITNIPEDLQKSALQVEVLGEQFMWRVRYPGADGAIGKRNYKLTSATNPYGIDFNDQSAWDDIDAMDIVLPVNKSVRFHILSKDIIHSFYIPDFRVQMNAVPGMTNYFQFTPTVTTEEMRERMDDPMYDYVMLCNKICGSAHYNMQKKVVVVTEAEYRDWLAKQNKYFNEAAQKEFAAASGTERPKDFSTASLN